MARKKTKYSYWELPEWFNVFVTIKSEYTTNDRKRLIISTDEREYDIRKPKNDTWKDVKVGDTVTITKKKHGNKNARLIITS